MMLLTPIEKVEPDLWVKRDDLFEIAGVRGGKARTCYHLATQFPDTKGLVTAGSRASPQVNIVAHIAKHLGLPCRVHTPTGALSPEVQQAQEAGALILQHKVGYNNVIIARAKKDAEHLGWVNIPFGMECPEAVTQTSIQVENLQPLTDKGWTTRLVIPVGSGMSLCGVLQGIEKFHLWERGLKSVLGVVVGADPTKRLLQYGPKDPVFGGDFGPPLLPEYLDDGRLLLVPTGTDYHNPAQNNWAGFLLDPYYEAKCVPHLRPLDLMWVVGVRRSLVAMAH